MRAARIAAADASASTYRTLREPGTASPTARSSPPMPEQTEAIRRPEYKATRLRCRPRRQEPGLSLDPGQPAQ
jgi:hypothetical protein